MVKQIIITKIDNTVSYKCEIVFKDEKNLVFYFDSFDWNLVDAIKNIDLYKDYNHFLENNPQENN